jgi:hypothetical protein
MSEYSITFIFDYVVLSCNPVMAMDEEEAIAEAKNYVAESGIDISNSRYGIEVEEYVR